MADVEKDGAALDAGSASVDEPGAVPEVPIQDGAVAVAEAPSVAEVGAEVVSEAIAKVPWDNRLVFKVEEVQKQMEYEMFPRPDEDEVDELGVRKYEKRTSSNELVKQLKVIAKEQDQKVAGLETVLEDGEQKLAKLQEKVDAGQSASSMSWDMGDLVDVLKEPIATGKEKDCQYRGIRVEDLTEFRDAIRSNLVDYCQAHQQNSSDFSHICLESPCRFIHFHIPFIAGSHGEEHQQDLIGSMYLVIERYVKVCLCEHKNWAMAINAVKERELLKVTTFVSHSWCENFLEFVDTLESALDPKEVVFVSAFAMDPRRTGQGVSLAADLCRSPFAAALQGCSQVLIAIDSQASVPKRLWCAFEISLAKSLRKPILMWPSASWNGKMKSLQSEFEQIDLAEAVASDKEDERKLKSFIGLTGGGFASMSGFLRSLFLDRIRVFARACQQALGDSGVDGKCQKARVRELQSRFETESVQQVMLTDVLRGDYEYAEVTGPLFPASDAVEPVYDAALGCLVSRVRGFNGMTRLKCSGSLELGFGTWMVGFVVRRTLPPLGCARRKDFHFHEDVALCINGTIEKCISLTESLGSTQPEWQMLVVGDVVIPNPGLGLLTRDTYTGTFSHKSLQKGKELDITVDLLWGLGHKELFKGTWTWGGQTYSLRCREEGLCLVFVDDVSKLRFYGRYVDTDDGVVFTGDVERSGAPGGEFEMTQCEEQLRCNVEVMLTGNETGQQQQGMMYSSNAFAQKTGGYKLPALNVPAQLSASYQSKPTCKSKTCECNSTPHSEYGLFIDRVFGIRQSAWLPKSGGGFSQGSVRAERSSRPI